LGAGKTYATRDHYDIDPNRELVGLGAANIGSALSSGMVVNGSLSKTAVNGSAGAHTELSGIVCAVMTVITLLFLTGLFEKLPEATLAAVVIAALVELVDFPALAELYRLYTRRLGQIYGLAARPDFIAAVAAMLGVLVFDTLPGLFIGIIVSLLLLLYWLSKPHVAELGAVPGGTGLFVDRDRHPESQPPAGVVIARVEGGLFFANADAVRNALRAEAARPGTRAVVLDLETMPFVDVTAVRMLVELTDKLDAAGVRFAMAHDVGQVRDLRGVEPGAEVIPVYPSVEAALQAVGAA
jgi:anti-anti-sigma factor